MCYADLTNRLDRLERAFGKLQTSVDAIGSSLRFGGVIDEPIKTILNHEPFAGGRWTHDKGLCPRCGSDNFVGHETYGNLDLEMCLACGHRVDHTCIDSQEATLDATK